MEMSGKQKIKHMTPEELKSKLYAHFEKNGSFAHLEAQLRGQMVSELFKVAQPVHPVMLPNSSDTGKCLLPLQVCNWLLYDHMSRQNYQYSLSIFVTEAQLPYPERFLTAGDVLRLLGLNHHATEFESISKLYSVNNEMGHLHSLLLSIIKILFNVPSRDSVLNQSLNVDSKIDDISKNEISGNEKMDDITCDKQVTVPKICALNKSVKSKRSSMDKNFSNNMMKSPEESFNEQLQNVKEENEREIQKLRHKLLTELENLHTQERKMQLEMEFTKSELQREKIRIEKKSELLKQNETLMEKEMAHKYQIKMQDIETNFASKLYFKDHEIETLKTKLSGKEQKLISLEAELSSMKDNFNIQKLELEDLKHMYKMIQDKYSTVLDENTNLLKRFENMSDYSILKEDLAAKSKEVSKLQNEIRDIHVKSEAERRKYVETVRNLENTLNMKEPQLIQTQKELNDLRNTLNAEESIWDKEKKKLEQELNEFKELYKNVIKRMEDQREDIQDLHKTIHILNYKITNNSVNMTKSEHFVPMKDIQRNIKTPLKSYSESQFPERNHFFQDSFENYKNISLQFLSDAKSRLSILKQEEGKVQDKYSFIHSTIPGNDKPLETYFNHYNLTSASKNNIQLSAFSNAVSDKLRLNFDSWSKNKMPSNLKSPYSIDDIKRVVTHSLFSYKPSHVENFDINVSAKTSDVTNMKCTDSFKISDIHPENSSQYKKYCISKDVFKVNDTDQINASEIDNSSQSQVQKTYLDDKNLKQGWKSLSFSMQNEFEKEREISKGFQQEFQTSEQTNDYVPSCENEAEIKVLSETNKFLPSTLKDDCIKSEDNLNNVQQKLPESVITENKTSQSKEERKKHTDFQIGNSIDKTITFQSQLLGETVNKSKTIPNTETISTVSVNLDDAWKQITSGSSLFPRLDKSNTNTVHEKLISEYTPNASNKALLNAKINVSDIVTSDDKSLKLNDQSTLPSLEKVTATDGNEKMQLSEKVVSAVLDDQDANILQNISEQEVQLCPAVSNTLNNTAVDSNSNIQELLNDKPSENIGNTDSLSELSEIHLSCGSEPEQQKEDSDAW